MISDALTAVTSRPDAAPAFAMPADAVFTAKSGMVACLPFAPRSAPHISGFSRFCNWIGGSGQRYIATVFAPDACPEIEDALALAVRCDGRGRREILAVADFGTFPALALFGIAFAAARAAGANEIHLHLLARSREARERIAQDLTGGALREGGERVA